MCRHRARARILRIGICYRPEQERYAINTADCLSKSGKNLLCENRRFRHSSAMRKVVRGVSDHRQPATSYRARPGD